MNSAWWDNRYIEALGWTLVHSLWELSLAAAGAAVTMELMRRRSAQARYLAGLGALLVMVALPAASYCYLFKERPAATEPPAAVARSEAATVSIHMPASIVQASETPTETPLAEQVAKRVAPALPYAVLGYAAGVMAMTLRLGMGCGRLRQLRRQTREAPAALQQRMVLLTRRLGVMRTVQLAESSLVESPTVLGAIKPVILMPAAALCGLTMEQMEGLLAHELAHIRRHDYAVNWLQSVAETVLFYHPAVWWISNRIRQEREHCCDDVAAEACGDRAGYVTALASMEHLRAGRLPADLAMGARGGSLLQRVRRLMQTPEQSSAGMGYLTMTSLLLAVLTAAAGLYVAGCAQRTGTETKAVLQEAHANEREQDWRLQMVRVYDIRDLLAAADEQALVIAGSGGEKPQETKSDSPQRQLALKEIMEVIQSTVEPGSWQSAEPGGGTMRELKGQLIISQSVENHKQIETLLEQLRQTRAVQIAMELRLALVDEATFRKLGFAKAPGQSPAEEALLNAGRMQEVLKILKDSKNTTLIAMPRITLFSGQKGILAMTSARNYAVDYQPKDPADPEKGYEYVMTTVQSGLTCDAIAAITSDRKQAMLKLALRLSDVERVDEKEMVAGGAKVKLQMPVTTTYQMRTMAAVPDGMSMMTAGPKVKGQTEVAPGVMTPEERYIVLLATPTLITSNKASSQP